MGFPKAWRSWDFGTRSLKITFVRPVPMIFRQTTNSNFEFVSKKGVGPNDLLTNFRHKLCAEMGGRPVACHACPALMTPMAYRPIIYPSRTAWCRSCASGRSQPFYRLWRSNIYATASRSGQRTAFRTEFVVACGIRYHARISRCLSSCAGRS